MNDSATASIEVKEEDKGEDLIDSHLNADGIQRLFDSMMGGHDGQAD